MNQAPPVVLSLLVLTFTVCTPPARSAPPRELEPLVTTATRTERSTEEIPAAVEVVSGEKLRDARLLGVKEALTVTFDTRGTLFFRDRPVTLRQLAPALQDQDRQTPVLIRADRQLVLQTFVDVMGWVRDLGFRRVSLQTEAG